MDSNPNNNELRYVRRPEPDGPLDSFLQTDSEYTMVAMLFMPPRTGKTTSVREAASRNGFTLKRFYNASLWDLIRRMVADGKGTFDEFVSVTDDVLDAEKDFGINKNTKTKKGPPEAVLIHYDEAQVFSGGIDTFRRTQFDFRQPPKAAQLAALVFHTRMLCNESVRLVVSGTSLKVSMMLQGAAANKSFQVSIPPTTASFVKEVLAAQTPSITASDEQAHELRGHVGQLYHVYENRNDRGEPVLDVAYEAWHNESSNWLQWDLTTALNASLLIAQLPSPSKEGYCEVEPEVKATSLYRRLLEDGAWVTIMVLKGRSVIVPLSSWQERALNSLYFEAWTLLTHSFFTQGALVSDPSEQECFAFQLMFALELTRTDSPLWKELGTQPIRFIEFKRFQEDLEWQPGVLYLVQESSKKKLADIVFVGKDDGEESIFALKLKCGRTSNVWGEFRSYNAAAAGTSASTDGLVRCFVSSAHVPRLDDPTQPVLGKDGTPDNRHAPVSSVNVRILNGVRDLETFFLLHPKLEQTTVLQFASSILRSRPPQQHSVVVLPSEVQGTDLNHSQASSIKRPRKDQDAHPADSAEQPSQSMRRGDGVPPVTSDVQGSGGR